MLEFLEIRELYVVSYVCTNFTRLLLIFLALVLVAEEVPHAQGLVVLDSWEKCTILTRITPSTNTRVKIRNDRAETDLFLSPLIRIILIDKERGILTQLRVIRVPHDTVHLQILIHHYHVHNPVEAAQDGH